MLLLSMQNHNQINRIKSSFSVLTQRRWMMSVSITPWLLLAALDLIQLFTQLLILILGFLQPATQISNLLLRLGLDVVSNDNSCLQICLELTPLHRLLLHKDTKRQQQSEMNIWVKLKRSIIKDAFIILYWTLENGVCWNISYHLNIKMTLCVTYLNLRGWRKTVSFIHHWPLDELAAKWSTLFTVYFVCFDAGKATLRGFTKTIWSYTVYL